MPLEYDTSTTSPLQSADQTKVENTPTAASTNMNFPSSIGKDAVPESHAKGKDKRPVSPSSSAPASKKPSTHSTSISEQKIHLDYKDVAPNWLEAHTLHSENKEPRTLQLTHHTGDMFSAPPNTLLIHACNTQGHWGAGIALTFKTYYPAAYAAHRAFCTKEHSKQNPVPSGTAQLLGPVDDGQH
jgi:ADP-ribose 1''-phosphate phosphatase